MKHEICAAMRLIALTSISQLDGYPAITSLDCIHFAGQKDTIHLIRQDHRQWFSKQSSSNATYNMRILGSS